AALIRGMSRSGTTIATGMALGMRREAAARFTFLMSAPAVFAAAVKEGLEMRTLQPDASVVVLMAVGFVTSGIVGYLTVKFFLKFLVSNRLDVFAWYRLALAAFAVAWLVAK
nr:hypothetical protein [Acidobacteriota bacterium]